MSSFWLEVDGAWRIMDKVMRSILRENTKLDPNNRRDQNTIARLLDERVKNDDRLRTAMAVTTMGSLILGSCVDGPGFARAILEVRRLVGCGHVSGLLRAAHAAGPDEVRGSGPNQNFALEAHRP
jgi:hypothetical protein